MKRNNALRHPARISRSHQAVWTVLAVAAYAALVPTPAIADTQATFAEAADIPHTVHPGDTLEALALQYFGDRRAWAPLRTLNRVQDPRRLRPGTVLRIPAHLLPQEVATVDFAAGAIAAMQPDGTSRPVKLAAGDKVPEGSRLQVGDEAFISLRLADGTVVRVRAASDVQLQQLRRRGRAGSVQSVLDVRAGAVESSVTPVPQSDRRFEVRTPMATTSVRGTRFSVELSAMGQTTTAVEEGSVAVQPQAARTAANLTMLEPGQGVAVAADGRAGPVRALLPPPDTSAIAAALHDADIIALSVPAVPGAVAYQVQIARDPDFTQVVRSRGFATPSFRLAGLPDGHYYLSIRGVDESGIAGRAARSAVTVKTQPVPPLYQSPAPGATISRTQGELRCTEVSGARFYRVQLAADAQFTQPLIDDARLPECRAAVAQVPPGTYFWRAASVRELPGGSTDEGPFARPQAVVVRDSPSALDADSMQTSDNDGEAGARLHWPAEPGQTFQLQVAATQDFTNPLVDTPLAQPTWSSNDLAPGVYQVRIRIVDPSGLQSDFSTPRQFRVGAAIQSSFGLPVTAGDGQPLSRP